MSTVENWEYTAVTWNASTGNEGAIEYIKKRWPKWTKIAKYSVESLIPGLNRLGKDGWELVHMESVWLDDDGAVIMARGAFGSTSAWFCVFKRKVVT
jgi:hypothetical protein